MNDLQYEYFVRRGFQCDKGKRTGADALYFEKLKLYGSNLRDQITEARTRVFHSQFNKVRDVMIKSLEHSKKRMKGDPISIQEVDRIIASVTKASVITDFEVIVADGVALYNALDINME